MISLTIPGRLRGKERPRFNGRHAYTPSKTRAAEHSIKQHAALAMRGKPVMEGPLSLDIFIWRHFPKSWSRKKREASRWVTGKPDPDNSGKLCADAFNKIIYHDDSQIADLRIRRMYISETPNPGERVAIVVRELG